MAGSVRRNGHEDGIDSLSLAVIDAVAAREGTDPEELPPLYDVIDPDALDSLFSPGDRGPSSGWVVFPYNGYEVSVTSGGEVSITERLSDQPRQ